MNKIQKVFAAIFIAFAICTSEVMAMPWYMVVIGIVAAIGAIVPVDVIKKAIYGDIIR